MQNERLQASPVLRTYTLIDAFKIRIRSFGVDKELSKWLVAGLLAESLMLVVAALPHLRGSRTAGSTGELRRGQLENDT